MQTVSQVLTRQRPRPAAPRRRYRHEALFVRDPLEYSTPLDRNARVTLIFLAERLERRTKGVDRRQRMTPPQLAISTCKFLGAGARRSSKTSANTSINGWTPHARRGSELHAD